MKRTTFVCDRCGHEAEARPSDLTPEGWANAGIRFDGLPKMGSNQLLANLDLCERCQDELKRVWEEWRNPEPPGAEAEAGAASTRCTRQSRR
jgi:hypothetical protein